MIETLLGAIAFGFFISSAFMDQQEPARTIGAVALPGYARAPQALPAMVTKPLRGVDEAALKPTTGIRRCLSQERVRQMIESITAIVGLLSVGIFVAHAVDAYITP
jgi:hypothetical protein